MAESAKELHPVKAFGLASRDSSGILSPFNFSVRATGEKDVKLKVLYCGICHTDLHQIRNDWGTSIFPMVPGHEVVGQVTEVGDKVEKKLKVGDNVGVGCMVGSCNSCESCSQDLENYCSNMVLTYNSLDRDGHPTYGGYSDTMVVNEHFVVKIPEGMALEASAPLLCAGITTYSPMRHLGLDKAGMRLGVVGLGGLGHVALKFAKAFGAKVTVISSSPGKKAEAMDRLGADSFLVSSDAEEMQAAMGSMDAIIDTVSAPHAITPLMGLLKTQGKLVIVGAPEKPLELPVFPLIMGRKTVVGSLIGGMKETQEMLDFAAENGITADIELISGDYVNTAMDRLAKGDVRYRFVIDIANTLSHLPSNK